MGCRTFVLVFGGVLLGIFWFPWNRDFLFICFFNFFGNLSIFFKDLFNLRFAAKELSRNAKKCEKQEKEEKVKLTNALKVNLFNFEHIFLEIFTIIINFKELSNKT